MGELALPIMIIEKQIDP